MGVYIKGMEMPKSCARCPTCREGTSLDDDWWLMCGYNGRPLEGEIGDGKPEWCPLVPVPPHYDLIDHNALKIAVMDCDAETRIDFLKHAMDCINKAPVVIPSDMPICGAEEGE